MENLRITGKEMAKIIGIFKRWSPDSDVNLMEVRLLWTQMEDNELK